MSGSHMGRNHRHSEIEMDWKKQNELYAARKMAEAEAAREALQALLDASGLSLTAYFEVNEGDPSWVVADVGHSVLTLGETAGHIAVRPHGHIGTGPDNEVLPSDLPAVVEWLLADGPERVASWDQRGIAIDAVVGRARAGGLDRRLGRFQQRWGREEFELELGANRASFRNDDAGRAEAVAWTEEVSSRITC